MGERRPAPLRFADHERSTLSGASSAPVCQARRESAPGQRQCASRDTSPDDAAVTEWRWDFDGDGDPDANTANASFTYTTAGAFEISLTVRDAEGLSQTKTRAITSAA